MNIPLSEKEVASTVSETYEDNTLDKLRLVVGTEVAAVGLIAEPLATGELPFTILYTIHKVLH